MRDRDTYDRNKAKQEAQRKKPFVQRWKIRLSNADRITQTLLVAFTFGIGVVGFLQWKTLDKTDKTLRDTLIVTQRPWVKAELGITSDLTFDPGGAGHLSFGIVLKNIGHALANNIAMNAIFVFINQKTFGHVIDSQSAICEKLSTRQLHPNDMDLTLFPGDEGFQQVGPAMAKEEIDASILGTVANSRFFAPIIVGCIDYRFSFDADHHQTMFAYDVLRKGSANTLPGLVLVDGNNVAKDDLVLIRWIFGGNDAN